MKSFFRTAPVALLGLVPIARAHSWIEQLMLIDDTGNMVGTPGYARGNVLRSANVDIDVDMTNLIPPNDGSNTVTADMNICMPSQQDMNNVTEGSPRLQAPAGAAVALRYHENGHVTKTQTNPGKPPNSGTVYVYGTTNSQPDDTLMAIHRVWNAAGTGGDARGSLIARQNFDDGQCYIPTETEKDLQRAAQFPTEQGSGGTVICQTDISLPSDLQTGSIYTLYWVWDWPTLTTNTQEIYTTCMDIEIVDASSVNASAAMDGAIQFATPSLWDNVAAATVVAAGIANTAAFVDDTGSTLPFSSGDSFVPSATSFIPSEPTTSDSPPPTTGFTSPPDATSVPESPAPETAAPSTILPIPPFVSDSPTAVTPTPETSSTELGPSETESVPVATTDITPTVATFPSSTEPTVATTPALESSNFSQAPSSTTETSFVDPLPSTTGFPSSPSTTSPFDDATSSSAFVPTPTIAGSMVTVTNIDSATATVFQTVTAATTFEKRSVNTQSQSAGGLSVPLKPCDRSNTKSGSDAHTGLRLRGRNPFFRWW